MKSGVAKALALIDPERAIQSLTRSAGCNPYFAGTDNSSSFMPFFAT